jgi:chromosomal replication initiation ATPase DnaA
LVRTSHRQRRISLWLNRHQDQGNGRENEARKVAMCLVKRCCDRTLPEIAEYFGTNGYATVSWNCRVVEPKMAKEMKFKDRSYY